ncbi:MAG: class I SAM-dependent methyltransferase [Mycobacterium sp.]|uniref:class I SAM-dependent methyltransferase n=1 Tax=Mycobacterium sp. TaxID=1785 RepID=UPI003C7609E2
MSSKHTLFRIFYRLGFTPWDGHPIATNLQDLVDELPAGKALDLGCGTGDASIYLAQHGWKVTGVDYVPQALDKARAKAAANKASVDFVHADVTQLSQEGIGADFGLIVDNGCLHNMSDGDRDAYVREVSAVAAPGARLLIVAFLPGGRFGVRGVQPAEMERRFTSTWTMLSTGSERELDQEQTPAKYYLYERKNP